MRIIVTDEFEKRFNRLPKLIREKAKKQERVFRENPYHPALNVEKLEPKNRVVWSFRVDKSYRIIFRFLDNNVALFLTIGPHDWVYKIKF